MVKRKVCCKWDENSDAGDGGQEAEINYPESDRTFLLPRHPGVKARKVVWQHFPLGFLTSPYINAKDSRAPSN